MKQRNLSWILLPWRW